MKYLEKYNNQDFPEVKTNHYMFTFRNSIYHIYYNQFLSYTDDMEVFPFDPEFAEESTTKNHYEKINYMTHCRKMLDNFKYVDCCRFIDQNINEIWWTKDFAGEQFMDIPTSTMQKILEYQGFSEEVQK